MFIQNFKYSSICTSKAEEKAKKKKWAAEPSPFSAHCEAHLHGILSATQQFLQEFASCRYW